MHSAAYPFPLFAKPFADRLFERAFEACPQAMSIVDMRQADQPLVFVNHAFELLTGYTRGEVLGRNCRFLNFNPADSAVRQRMRHVLRAGERLMVVLPNRRKDGREFRNELLLEPIRDEIGTVTHYVAVQSDLDQRERRDTWALEVATHGLGTTLSPRAALHDRVEQALGRSRWLGTRCAVLLVEMPAASDDAHGLDGSPSRYSDIGRVIGEALPNTPSSLCRVNQKQLALLLDPAPAPPALVELARRILAAVRANLALQGGRASCHLGIAVGPTDGDTAQELVIAAGHALDRARLRESTADIAFFSNTQDAQLLYLRQMEADLIAALSSQQFALAFQPIVHLDNACIAGFEAQLQWTHPVCGQIGPADFLEAAEASGMTVRLSEWVVAQALAALEAFDRLGGAPVRMFIKIAASHFEQDGFVEALREQMLAHGTEAGRLELEISERAVIDLSPSTLHVLYALRQLGVATAIDDFGSGQSNLHKLTELPVDAMKIGRSLTQASTQSSAVASVSGLICELARMLDLRVVVDGITTAGQLRHFQALGCRYGQGDLFSPALPYAAASRLLQAGKPLFVAAKAEAVSHLLLLDDEENILRALRRVLRHEGYQVHFANTPLAAFELLATHPIGVVLSDQRMPQMNGTDFLRQVKKLYPNTIRMVLSGYSELQTVQSAVNEGAIWKFLSKPWDDGELRQQIRDAFHEYAVLRDADVARARLESQVSQRDQQLALEVHALESSRDTLSMLPIAVLGVDCSQMVVMSNLEADRLLGAGVALMGSPIGDWLPHGYMQALVAPGPIDLDVGGGHFRLHVQAMGPLASPRGYLLSFVPRCTS